MLGLRAAFVGTPTSTTRPCAEVTSYAVSITSATPVFSIATSTPDGPAISRMRSETFSPVALIVCVAPSRRAASSLWSCRSTAMIGWAAISEASCTRARPTPPEPSTATLWPIPSRASLLSTPIAVVTAQPKSAPTSGSKSAGIGVTRFSETIECSLNVVTQPALTRPKVSESNTGGGA